MHYFMHYLYEKTRFCALFSFYPLPLFSVIYYYFPFLYISDYKIVIPLYDSYSAS